MLAFIEKIIAAWAETARRGGPILAAAILVLAGLAGFYAATHLRVNTDTSAMLDPNLPFQKRAVELRDAFPSIKNDVVVIVRAPTLDEADAYAGALRQRLLSRKDEFSAVFATAQEPFFRENGLLFLSESELQNRLTQLSKASGLIETLIKDPSIGALFTTLAQNDELAERSELGKDTIENLYASLGDSVEAALAGREEPFSWLGALDGDDGAETSHTRLLYATPSLDFARLQPAKPAVLALRAETEALDAEFSGRVETYVTGDPALRMEELEAVTTGLGMSFLLSFFLVSALLLICYRSVTMAAMTMLALVIALTLTSAFAAMFVGELNLVSVAFTVLLIGLGLDFAIHLLLHIQEHRAAGHDNRKALRDAVHEVGPGLALAAFTTTIAFLSFMPTKFDGIAQLGMIAGAGVVISFVVTLTFAPASLCFIRKAPRPLKNGGIMGGGLGRMSGPLAVATVIFGLGALTLMPQVRFDADQMALRNPHAQSVQGFNLLFDSRETSPYRLSAIAGSQEEAGRIAQAAKALATVDSVRVITDFVPDAQDEKLDLIDIAAGSLVFALDAEPASAPGVSASDGVAALRTRLDAAHPDGAGARLAGLLARLQNDDAASGLLQKNIFAYWPQLIETLRAQLNAGYVELDDLPAGLRERYLSADGKWRVDILPKEDVRNPKALDAFVADVESALPDLAGGAYQARKAGETISAAMLEATGIAFALIALFLWALVRSLRTVALMMFPLALAGVLTAAAGVALGVPFNYANVIVLPLLIGIGIDSGIHLVLRNDQIKAGEGVYGTSTPRAVLFSALTTIASFGSLMLSPHRGTASMGELLSIAILFTLVCTLVVLPAAMQLEKSRCG